MTLRRKLLTVFTALMVMSLLSAGLTIWSTLKQHALLEQLETQYAQNTLLQRLRTTTGSLFRQHAMAIVLDRPLMSDHLDEQDKRIRQDLERWQQHAEGPDERQRMQAVQQAYTTLSDGLAAWLRHEENPVDESGSPVPGQEDFRDFRTLVDDTLEANQRARDAIHARIAGFRDATQLAVVVSAFGTLCLVLLVSAYVASDLFAPLRSLEEALNAVSRGDMQRRLDAERDDELGQVSRAFNRAVEGMARLTTTTHLPNAPDGAGAPELHASLRRLEDELQDAALGLAEAAGTTVSSAAARALVSRSEELCATVQRITTLYLPAPLEIMPIDVGSLLYELVAKLHQDFARRSVAIHIHVAPELPLLLGDRLRLGEMYEHLLRDALDVMSPQRALLELRAEPGSDMADQLTLELVGSPTDSGGVLGDPTDRPSALWASASLAVVVARRIVEQHGGTLTMHTHPDGRRSLVTVFPLLESVEALADAAAPALA